MKDLITANELGLFETESVRDSDGYDSLLNFIELTFSHNLGEAESEPLFTTDASGLFDLFLHNLPFKAMQHYNCNACRHFVDRFGGLVRITKEGRTVPAMWAHDAPPFFYRAVNALKLRVSAANVTGIFIPDGKRLGTPTTGYWHHMAVTLPRSRWHTDKLRTAHEAAAAKNEDHRLLREALAKYHVSTVKRAVNLLRSGTLGRVAGVADRAEWFLKVMNKEDSAPYQFRANLRWRAAAMAPAGFCHISSSVLGTLLDDCAEDLDPETIARRFDEKLNPLKYQRPQAAPTVGNIAQAEKIVEKLGIANSLKRRFARLEELELIWRTVPEKSSDLGVFSHLLPKQYTAPIHGESLTWAKFRRTVLPNARKIDFYITGMSDTFGAITTAVDPSAPPIIQWDTEEKRNPFAWYVYANCSSPTRWGLPVSGYVPVTGITLQPSMWQHGYQRHGESAFFILKGCVDTDYEGGGLALFPEILKGELHEIRSTIAAYSRAGTLDGFSQASACGIRVSPGRRYRFRVTTDAGVTEYTIDRWD